MRSVDLILGLMTVINSSVTVVPAHLIDLVLSRLSSVLAAKGFSNHSTQQQGCRCGGGPWMWHSLVPASGWACVTLRGERKEEAMACTTNMPDLSLTAPSDVALMAEWAACRILLSLNMLLRQTLSLRKNVNVSNGVVLQTPTVCCSSFKKGYLSMQLVLLWDKWGV